MISGNPFILTYDALWDLAEASALLTSLVRLKNRIRFDHTRPGSPVKDEVSQADLPELALVCTTAAANLRNTSSTSNIVRTYEWLISTGDMSVSNKLLPVEWALYCAMVSWPTVVNALKWNEKPFVKRVNFNSITSGFSDPERNRGIEGWSSIWGIEVEMYFASADMIEVGVAGTGT